MERAVIYCRVSSKEQVDNFSLTSQERLCREYCERNGYEVDKVFVEEGESAKTANRRSLLRMLDYCGKAKGRISVLVVYQLSRFARQAKDHHAVKAKLASFGITLRSVTEPIDDSPMGKAMENMAATFAQLDNDLRSDRTKTGMLEAAMNGRWVHQAPIGYINGKKGGPSLIHDPECADLVRKGFELFAKRMYSKQQVVDKINALGFTSPKGGKLNPQTFGRMLRNPLYAGRVILESFQIDTEGDFKPIVPEDLFRKVQAILDGRTYQNVPHHRNNKDFPLRRFTRCAKCGTPLTGSWSTGRGKKYAYYRCRNTKCKAVNIRKENMEELFLEQINRIKPRMEYMRLFREIVKDVYRERMSEGTEHKKRLQANLRKLKKKKSRLVDLRIEEEIDHDSYQSKKIELDAEIEQVERELGRLNSGTMDIDSALDFAERIVMNAGKLWEALEFDERVKLQELLFTGGIDFDGEKFGTIKNKQHFQYVNRKCCLL